jgi:NarL family two-component system response regulator LiaR
VKPISVAIADDHRVVSRGLKAYRQSFSDLTVVGTASSGEELLAHLCEWRADVVIQDLLLPGGIDGIETTRRIVAQRPVTRVLALTASTDEPRMMAVLRAGASGYVRKDAEPELLLDAVRKVGAGGTFIDPAVVLRLDRDGHHVEALRLLALGWSNAQIAAHLGIGDETVKTHVGRLLSKLDVENRAQAAVQALKRGLVSFDDVS